MGIYRRISKSERENGLDSGWSLCRDRDDIFSVIRPTLNNKGEIYAGNRVGHKLFKLRPIFLADSPRVGG